MNYNIYVQGDNLLKYIWNNNIVSLLLKIKKCFPKKVMGKFCSKYIQWKKNVHILIVKWASGFLQASRQAFSPSALTVTQNDTAKQNKKEQIGTKEPEQGKKKVVLKRRFYIK